MSRDAALRMAASQGLDLIEISPNASPPIAKITSFDKYRYEQEKLARKERRAQKSTGVKQIRITPRAAANDLAIRIRKLEEFLNEGHQVEIMMKLRGREKGNKEWAFQKMKEFLAKITVEYKTMSPPKAGGIGITAHIVKAKQ